MRMLAIASLAVIAATSAQAAPAAGAGGLAAHRAVYDLSLKDASERSGISGMVGRMVYEFAGSACEGYTVSFRFVTEISTGEDSRLTDQQTTTFEDIRKGTFRFVTRSFVDQKLDHEVRGSAEVKENGLALALEQPDKLSLEIAPARFPTEHMIELIGKAREGERFYESRIYDGSDEGDKAMITTTILGPRNPTRRPGGQASLPTTPTGPSRCPISRKPQKATACRSIPLPSSSMRTALPAISPWITATSCSRASLPSSTCSSRNLASSSNVSRFSADDGRPRPCGLSLRANRLTKPG